MIFLVVLAALTAYVAAPLYSRAAASAIDDRRGTVRLQLDAVVSELRELELDHSTGVVGDDEYRRQRAAAEERAVRLASSLDDPGD